MQEPAGLDAVVWRPRAGKQRATADHLTGQAVLPHPVAHPGREVGGQPALDVGLHLLAAAQRRAGVRGEPGLLVHAPQRVNVFDRERPQPEPLGLERPRHHWAANQCSAARTPARRDRRRRPSRHRKCSCGAELLALVDVADVHLHQWRGQLGAGVAQHHAGVAPAGRIEHDRMAGVGGFVQPADQLGLAVGLPYVDGQAELLAGGFQHGDQVGVLVEPYLSGSRLPSLPRLAPLRTRTVTRSGYLPGRDGEENPRAVVNDFRLVDGQVAGQPGGQRLGQAADHELRDDCEPAVSLQPVELARLGGEQRREQLGRVQPALSEQPAGQRGGEQQAATARIVGHGAYDRRQTRPDLGLRHRRGISDGRQRGLCDVGDDLVEHCLRERVAVGETLVEIARREACLLADAAYGQRGLVRCARRSRPASSRCERRSSRRRSPSTPPYTRMRPS